ncbi:MAG: hypothetical protein V4710_00670 [Verrucomicrobiota bacterium]
MTSSLKKTIRIALCIVVAFVATFAGLFLLIVQPGGSGVLASLRLPDGSEYMITQRCNWSPEPYTVAFYMRPAGGQWGWCYIDHEAARWRKVAMTHDAASDKIVVTEQGTERAILDRQRNAFWIDNGDIRRELTAPQDYREPRYAFQ